MNSSEQEYVKAINKCHQKIIDCPDCLGGVTPEGIECICRKKYLRIYNIYKAGIPFKLKTASLSQFYIKSDDKNIETLETYIHFIDKMKANGTHLWIAGGVGSGKSLVICSVLLKAIEKSYTAYYMDIAEFYRLQEVRFSKISDEKYRYNRQMEFWSGVDFLSIDGLGLGSQRSRDYGREALMELIKQRIDGDKLTILGTLASEDKDLHQLSPELPSILKANFLNVTLTGTDEYIQKKQESIADEMKRLTSELKRSKA